MTNTALERAKEIRYEIDGLKVSLSQVSRGKLFDLDVGSGCINRSGDPFLASLENDLKTYANVRILDKINALEEEFKAL